MKTLKTYVMHGSQMCKRTGYQLWPGYVMAHFTDGTSQYFTESARLPEFKAAGIDCAEFEVRQAAADKANAYPEKPTSELYQHNYGYERPTELGAWSWSVTFGRWSRLVTFSDGWHGYTFPQS